MTLPCKYLTLPCKYLTQGASAVCAFCTHAVFPLDSWTRFAKGGDRAFFRKFWVTNSNPSVTRKLPRDDCFEILDLVDVVLPCPNHSLPASNPAYFRKQFIL